jgi:uncharacterized protein (TIGR02147 family)
MTEVAFYQTVIREELAKRCAKNPRYSLRAFAKALGFESTVISQVLSGRRVPSPRTARKMIAGLALSPEQEHDFYSSLAEVQRSRGLRKLSPVFKKIYAAGSVRHCGPKDISIDVFRVISEWYHIAILELTYVRDFRSDPAWIASQLGITPIEAKLAIERLLNLGLLEVRDGKLAKTEERLTTADKHLTTPGLRNYQKQLLGKAIDSLENDPIEARSMSGITMSADPKNIALAKKLIDECARQISQLMQTGTQTDVYQLQISLYPLTKPEKKENGK